MTRLFDGLSHFALVLQRGAGQAAWQNFALLIAEHQQEISVLVVDVLDAFLLETAVLLRLGINADWIQVTYVLVSHGELSVVGVNGGFLLLARLVAARFSISHMVLVHLRGEESDDALISTEFSLEGENHRRIGFELKQLVEACGLLLNGVSQLPETPCFLVDNVRAIVLEVRTELLNCFRYLLSRQHGSNNENSFVSVHLIERLMIIGAQKYCWNL